MHAMISCKRAAVALGLNAALFWLDWAQAQPIDTIQPANTPAASASQPESAHSLADDNAAIRRHRLKHLEEKLTVEPKVLKDACRYESDIATPPPHKRVALTFDDGPEPGQTELILQVLKKHGISASFFMIGEKLERHPELLAAVRAAGSHLVGNHSWDHPNFHSISVDAQSLEVLKAAHALGAQSQAKLFRYPYGNSSCATNALLKQLGYQMVGWHVDSCDWAFDRDGTVDVKEATECGVLPAYRGNYVEHVLSAVRAHNGGIILMHEIHPHTLQHLDQIITQLERDGYEFGSLDEPAFAPSLR